MKEVHDYNHLTNRIGFYNRKSAFPELSGHILSFTSDFLTQLQSKLLRNKRSVVRRAESCDQVLDGQRKELGLSSSEGIQLSKPRKQRLKSWLLVAP